MADYWTRFSAARTTRRRALALSAAGTSLLFLGCSSSDDDKSDSSESALVRPADSTSQAVPGGKFIYNRPDVSTLDPVRDGSRGPNQPYGDVYSRLVKYKVGTPDNRPAGEVEGDVAESWEDTPDGLTYTFKLRGGMKFDRRPPTNGREITSEDVKYSWESYVADSPSGGELARSVSPSAPVLSLETPDRSTVTMKLAFPFAGFLPTLAYHRNMYIVPIEAEGKFDLAREMRGSGPWMLTSYKQNVSYEFEKNPDFYVKNRPFLDGFSNPVIPEYSTGIANLQAGNLDFFVGSSISAIGVRAEDVLSIKAAQPRLVLFSEGYNPNPPQLIAFSQQPNQPFLDERVRRAVSMLLERELWADTFFNVESLNREGIDVSWAPNTHYGAGQSKYWVDPRDDKLGSSGKYLTYNPEEAKKLLQAAGISGPLASTISCQDTRSRFAEVLQGMLQANNDFKLEIKVVPADEDRTKFHRAKGNFPGMTLQAPGSGGDIDVYFSARYLEGASGFTFWDKSPYPELEALLVQQRKELDDAKRTELIKGPLQRKFAEIMPTVPYPSIGEELNLVQPWIRNLGAVKGMGSNDGYDVLPSVWYDASKK